MKYQIETPSLSRQKIQETKFAYIELFDDRIEYGAHFIAQHPLLESDDEVQTWKDPEPVFNIRKFRKSVCCGVEMSSNNTSKAWDVSICVEGNADIALFYKSKADATAMFDILSKWLFG